MALVPIFDEALELLTDYVTEQATSKADDVFDHAMSQYGPGGRASGNKRGAPPQLEPPMTHPGEPPRQSSTGQVTTNAAAAGGGSTMEVVTPQNSVLTSGLTNSLKYFDSHLLQSAGEKSLLRLQVKLGKQVYPDCITPFLKHLSGSGKVRMQFGGRCLADVNVRHIHMQAFRHRLSAGTSTDPVAWPAGTENRILGPNNTVAFVPAGPGASGTPTPFPIDSTSMRDITDGFVYYAPYNKADLEDLSWNLNTLKLGNPDWTAGADPVVFLPNVPLFVPDKHARQSQIAVNNVQVGNIPGTLGHTAPYMYNAVFNKGTILYNFMNKGLGGAKIDLIVYRTKKNQIIDVAGNTLGTQANVPLNRIVTPIGRGYMAAALAKSGTDSLGGRPPEDTDVSSNPAFPFLPEIKRTQQSQLPFVEVARQTFAMPSGSRREVNIVLPGTVYDPVNIGTVSGYQTGAANAFPPVFDDGTFCIVMSVSGQKCTQEVVEAGTAYNIGDMYAGANIQFYGTYTEHMGACQYKHTPTPNMYSQGALLIDAPPAAFKVHPITMLPQNQAVRIPASSSTVGGTNLANDYGATA